MGSDTSIMSTSAGTVFPLPTTDQGVGGGGAAAAGVVVLEGESVPIFLWIQLHLHQLINSIGNNR